METEKRRRVDSDGTEYEWDEEQKAWFPMISEDFLAQYQANYGFIDNTQVEVPKPAEPELTTKSNSANSLDVETDNKSENKTSVGGKQNGKRKPQWFELEQAKNNNVYVNGLPKDVTIDEFKEFMTKCGIVAYNDNGEPKLKLYKDKEGNNKGDGLCCYLKHESVDLALTILDKSSMREGSAVSVQQAVFELKGEYNSKANQTRKRKKKPSNKQEKLLDWVDRETNKKKKHLSVVVLKNLFETKELDEHPELILDIKKQLRTIGSEFGKVKRVLLFDRSNEGVCSITYETEENAKECQEKLDRKHFRGRTIKTAIWDGVTNYKTDPNNITEIERLKKWDEYLETED